MRRYEEGACHDSRELAPTPRGDRQEVEGPRQWDGDSNERQAALEGGPSAREPQKRRAMQLQNATAAGICRTIRRAEDAGLEAQALALEPD